MSAGELYVGVSSCDLTIESPDLITGENSQLPSTFKVQTVASPEGADIFVRSEWSEPRFRRQLSCAGICPQRPNHLFHLLLELRVILLPAGKIGCETSKNLFRFAVTPLEQIAVEIQWNQRKHLSPMFRHELLFLREGAADLVVHPPAR